MVDQSECKVILSDVLQVIVAILKIITVNAKAQLVVHVLGGLDETLNWKIKVCASYQTNELLEF